MPLQVPMYQPRIPIGGGGGVIDLSAKENQSKRLIAQAIGQILGSVGRGRQEKDMAGQVVVSEGKTWLVDRKTGRKIDLGLKANPRVEELLKLIDMARKYEKPSEVETAISESAEEELLGTRGLEEYEEEYEHDPWWGKPRMKTRTEIRRIGQQPERTTPISAGLQSIADRWLAPQDTGTIGPSIKRPIKAFKGAPAGMTYPYTPPRKKVEAREVPTTVKMKSPDGKTYEVPQSEVEEAKKHGWKVI